MGGSIGRRKPLTLLPARGGSVMRLPCWMTLGARCEFNQHSRHGYCIYCGRPWLRYGRDLAPPSPGPKVPPPPPRPKVVGGYQPASSVGQLVSPPKDPRSANAVQVGGDHYRQHAVQPWDAIEAWGLGFLDGNVVKYIARWRLKGGRADLLKARHYLDKLIEQHDNGVGITAAPGQQEVASAPAGAAGQREDD